MQEYLKQLNEAQLAPVLQKEGAMIVIAGAGSGKTRVLTYKIAYLMSKGVDAFNILALTFTNKAAREMKERISSMLDDNESKNLWIGTFHSVFAKILRIEADKLGYPTNFTIYDTQDSQKLVSSIISELNLDKEIYDNCIVCSTETHIANLSLVSGKCFICENNAAKNKKVLKEMVRISKEMGEL